jgi:hypothetical protein
MTYLDIISDPVMDVSDSLNEDSTEEQDIECMVDNNEEAVHSDTVTQIINDGFHYSMQRTNPHYFDIQRFQSCWKLATDG